MATINLIGGDLYHIEISRLLFIDRPELYRKHYEQSELLQQWEHLLPELSDSPVYDQQQFGKYKTAQVRG